MSVRLGIPASIKKQKIKKFRKTKNNIHFGFRHGDNELNVEIALDLLFVLHSRLNQMISKLNKRTLL